MNSKNLLQAKIIMVIVILFSSCIAGVVGLKMETRRISKSFYDKEQGLILDMEKAATGAGLIGKVAQVQNVADASALMKANDLYHSVDDMQQKQIAFANLKEATEALIVQMDKADLDYDTKQFYQAYKAEFEEGIIFMRRHPLNDEIDQFNQMIDEFPASLFVLLAGVDKLADFR